MVTREDWMIDYLETFWNGVRLQEEEEEGEASKFVDAESNKCNEGEKGLRGKDRQGAMEIKLKLKF
jgi:hypothetical protein